MRIAALYSHPVQYTAPLFRELSSRPGVEFKAYFLSRAGVDDVFDEGFRRTISWDVPLLDGYESEFLPNRRTGDSFETFFGLLNTTIWNVLRKQRYDALLVHGYEHFPKWLAFYAAKRNGTRLILRGESHVNRKHGRAFLTAKKVLLTNLFKNVDAFAYIGTLNRNLYESFGVDRSRLYFAPYSVDNRFFAGSVRRLRDKRDELRQEIGLSTDSPVILFVGKLCARKQPILLLRAFAAIRTRHKCQLIFAGDGEMRAEILREAKTSAIPDVHITGFLNQTEMPRAYALADIFVLPSSFETWGLVVNEAMAAGLPIVAARTVGCSTDLIQAGRNGFTFGVDSQEQLIQSLEQLVINHGLRGAFGHESSKIIEGWSIDKCADGIMDAARGRDVT